MQSNGIILWILKTGLHDLQFSGLKIFLITFFELQKSVCYLLSFYQPSYHMQVENRLMHNIPSHQTFLAFINM